MFNFDILNLSDQLHVDFILNDFYFVELFCLKRYNFISYFGTINLLISENAEEDFLSKVTEKHKVDSILIWG